MGELNISERQTLRIILQHRATSDQSVRKNAASQSRRQCRDGLYQHRPLPTLSCTLLTIGNIQFNLSDRQQPRIAEMDAFDARKNLQPRLLISKVGIILSGLVPSEELTKRMFDNERFQRQHKLMKAVDVVFGQAFSYKFIQNWDGLEAFIIFCI